MLKDIKVKDLIRIKLSSLQRFDYLVCKRCYSSGSLVRVSGNKVRCLCCGATYYLDDNGSLRDSCTKDLGRIGRYVETFMKVYNICLSKGD